MTAPVPTPFSLVPDPVASTVAGIAWSDPARRDAFFAWLGPLAATHALRLDTLAPASQDASFRRYFRLQGASGPLIVMDAPPPQEDVRPFVHVAGLIHAAGLRAPRVLAADEALGFLLLDDLGSELYLHALQHADIAAADTLMRQALNALVQWQARVDPATLPPYDEALLRRELDLFPAWCVELECGQVWGEAQRAHWERVCQALVGSALAQPRVAVHRDWMPRNLMVTDPNPGILDFQDAVHGPVTYDVASMLRDAFISWDEERELDWAVRYWEAARQAGLFGSAEDGAAMRNDFGEFWRALEWMGLQRHLKVLGIFCRLKHRDGKPGYSADLPRFFGYAHKVAMRYAPLAPLRGLIEPLYDAQVSVGYTF